MTWYPALLTAVALCVAGCSTPTVEVRFVPTSTAVRVEPQPTTYHEFRVAEREGCSVVATGVGVAYGIDDRCIQFQPGQRLRVLRVDPATGEVLVRRLDDNALARMTAEGVEARATTYTH